jgi:hypothetical protein
MVIVRKPGLSCWFIGLVILDELIYLRRRAFLLHLRKPYARQRDDQHQPELC